MQNPQRTAFDSPPAHIHKKYSIVTSIQYNNWVWVFFLMNNRGELIICWNTLFFYKHQLNWVQPQLCLIWNLFFLKIYSTNPYDFMLEILFRTSLFFWYIKILLKCFGFWDVANVKPKFQLRYALCLWKKNVWKMWKKVIDYCEK